METNLLLANIHFVESDFDSACKLFIKIQTLNHCPNILFKVVNFSQINHINTLNDWQHKAN